MVMVFSHGLMEGNTKADGKMVNSMGAEKYQYEYLFNKNEY